MIGRTSVKKPPPPMHYELLASAPGPEKVPFFSATRSTGHRPLDCGDREPTRVGVHDFGVPLDNTTTGPMRGRSL